MSPVPLSVCLTPVTKGTFLFSSAGICLPVMGSWRWCGGSQGPGVPAQTWRTLRTPRSQEGGRSVYRGPGGWGALRSEHGQE